MLDLNQRSSIVHENFSFYICFANAPPPVALFLFSSDT